MLSSRTMFYASRASLANHQQSAPRGVCVSVLAIRCEEVSGRLASIQPAQQYSRRRLEDVPGRVSQQIRNADICGILAQPNCVSEICIGMILNDKVRRPAFAANAGVDPLENALATGNQAGAAFRKLHDCFLRTGGGAAVFSALSTSVSASLVPSIASSSVSLYVSSSCPFS